MKPATVKYLGYAVLFWAVVAILFVIVLERWPQAAQSPWAFAILFLVALVASRIARKWSGR